MVLNNMKEIEDNPQVERNSEALPDLSPLVGQASDLANPVDMYLAGKSRHTQRMTRSHMDRVARLFGYTDYLKAPWGSLRYIHVQQVMDYLQEQKYSPSTINATLAAIRGTAQTAFNLYRMDGDDLARIRAIKMVRGSRLPTGRMIPLGEISSLVNTCIADEKASGPRDAAIIGLLYIAGLRRAEVVYLQRKDVDIKNQVLTVIGKGNKQRKAFLDIGTINALKDWLKYRTDIAGPLFVRVLKNGTLKFSGLTDQAIYEIVRKRWKQANIPPISPHDFRKTFISSLLGKGVDVFTVQRMAGHADPQTTSKYDLRPEEDARAATELLHLPYTSK
ncbi:tyrosine-type recombinase/integrase [Thiolapillus sp.]|uniref:tyrosine-type recombinase/integrase n=2 Tax=Thiolapillus sp. TaxID=2017437 RepID=UPI003AF88050